MRRSPIRFFILTFALSAPFLLLAAVAPVELLPGLPISSLAAVCPGLAAVILLAHEGGRPQVRSLLRRAVDIAPIRPIWLLPILLLMPAERVVEFWLLRLSGIAVPAPSTGLLRPLALSAAFFVGALAEEVGWSGYAIDPIQRRIGASPAAILLGLMWAAYHYGTLVQAHRPLAWMLWWALGTVAIRVIIVWLYNNTGRSVLAASLFHMTVNVTWQLFPIAGSYYDPRISSLILTAVALGVALASPSGDRQSRLEQRAHRQS